MEYKNGDYYIGECKKGTDIPYGRGMTYTLSKKPAYTTEGWSRKNGKVEGYCRRIFDNGDLYVGNFDDHKFNGEGTFTWENGDKYEGHWEDDKQDGKGIFYFANGDRFEGKWIFGKR